MYSFLFLTATSLMICLALTPLCRDFFVNAGLLDHPDHGRKLHARPIPRTGGIPIAIAYLGSVVLLLISPLTAGSVLEQYLPLALKLLPAAGLIVVAGLVDRLIGRKARQK